MFSVNSGAGGLAGKKHGGFVRTPTAPLVDENSRGFLLAPNTCDYISSWDMDNDYVLTANITESERKQYAQHNSMGFMEAFKTANSGAVKEILPAFALYMALGCTMGLCVSKSIVPPETIPLIFIVAAFSIGLPVFASFASGYRLMAKHKVGVDEAHLQLKVGDRYDSNALMSKHELAQLLSLKESSPIEYYDCVNTLGHIALLCAKTEYGVGVDDETGVAIIKAVDAISEKIGLAVEKQKICCANKPKPVSPIIAELADITEELNTVNGLTRDIDLSVAQNVNNGGSAGSVDKGCAQ